MFISHLPDIDLSIFSKDHDFSSLINVQNDYGTPNLLFFYNKPFLVDEAKVDFQALQDDLQAWNAWEAGWAEVQTNANIKKKNLPSDDSISSRVQRSNYRAKVIDYLRENSEKVWLSLKQLPTLNTFSKNLEQTEVAAAIRTILFDLYGSSREPNQSHVILSILSNIIASNPEKKHQYYFTNIYYNFDSENQVFIPDIHVSQIIAIQKPSPSAKGIITLEINSLDSKYEIDIKKWSEKSHEVKDFIRYGENIRKEMALNFTSDKALIN